MATTTTATRPAAKNGKPTAKNGKPGKAPARPAKPVVPDRAVQAHRAAILMKQASDPTRITVLLILAEGEQHVGALCAQLNQSQPAISHHLALLRHSRLIEPRRQGKNNFYSLTDEGRSLAEVVRGLISA
jgi:DNA-binding transcriptional ArsR family regulator